MKNWIITFEEKESNGGTKLALMGIEWLYIWVFPLHQTFIDNPHWGEARMF